MSSALFTGKRLKLGCLNGVSSKFGAVCARRLASEVLGKASATLPQSAGANSFIYRESGSLTKSS